MKIKELKTKIEDLGFYLKAIVVSQEGKRFLFLTKPNNLIEEWMWEELSSIVEDYKSSSPIEEDEIIYHRTLNDLLFHGGKQETYIYFNLDIEIDELSEEREFIDNTLNAIRKEIEDATLAIKRNEIYEHGYPESRLVPSNFKEQCEANTTEYVVDKVGQIIASYLEGIYPVWSDEY